MLLLHLPLDVISQICSLLDGESVLLLHRSGDSALRHLLEGCVDLDLRFSNVRGVPPLLCFVGLLVFIICVWGMVRCMCIVV